MPSSDLLVASEVVSTLRFARPYDAARNQLVKSRREVNLASLVELTIS
jgi:hypothetical protein